MLHKKFVYILNYFTTHKAALKRNPRTQSKQQNKKAVLATAAYFKVSTPVMSQKQKCGLLIGYASRPSLLIKKIISIFKTPSN